jgi:hypothetical protein
MRTLFALTALSLCGCSSSSTGSPATPLSETGPDDGVVDTGGDGASPSGLHVQSFGASSADKVDLLVMVDNSASMADKYSELGRRMPELIKALTDPDLDASGKPKTKRVSDLHVGIITSSLGSHGTSACDPATYPHSDDHGHLMPRASENGVTGYTVDSVGGAPTAVACPAPVAASALTWAFDPAKGAQYSAQAGAKGMEAAVSCIVQSAKEDGCGYEAQLESVYHFLIDPAPYLTADVVPACTKSPAGDSCGSGKVTPMGVDQVLLNERAAFLRPDSVLTVVMLSDENDGSLLPAGLNWIPMAYAKGTMLRGWKGCETVPDDFEPQTSADYADLWSKYHCISCFQKSPDGTTDANCSLPWASTALNNDVDGTNERMLQHTRRYGYNFLWGRQRYVDAFSATTVAGSDGKIAPNPIFAGGMRTKDMVLVAGILGVAPKLIPTNADGTSKAFTAADWERIVSPDLAKRDPHMIEQIAPRTAFGVAKFAGDRSVDPVNGGDRDISDGNDLQYACIGPRDPSVAALPSTGGDCSAAGSGTRNPICGPNSGTRGTQPFLKAYPTLRELRVIHELELANVPTVVGSICNQSYSPITQAIAAKLQAALSGSSSGALCATPAPTVTPSGLAACAMIEVFATAQPSGAVKCESIPGYCTPGAPGCRIAGSSLPPVDAANAVAGLALPVPMASGTENVMPALATDGNVYATGSDGTKHLVCEVMPLGGNPAIDLAKQSACAHDAAYAQTIAGWCWTSDAALSSGCSNGAYRPLGGVPRSGSKLSVACR